MPKEARCVSEYNLIVLPDDHVIGRLAAPITIIEYGDFECPSCRNVQPLINRLCATFSTHIRFVYRHFPLTQKHPHAQLAAEASEAAALQDRFWPLHDVLLQHQTRLELDNLYLYAKVAGLNVTQFKNDLHGLGGVMKVRRDVLSGHRCGVRGTPTFFVNNMLLSDSDDLEPTILSYVKDCLSHEGMACPLHGELR